MHNGFYPLILSFDHALKNMITVQAKIDEDLLEAAARTAQACTAGCSNQQQQEIAEEIACRLSATAGGTDALLTVASAAALALRPGVSPCALVGHLQIE